MGLCAIGTRRVREDREGRMVGCQGREGEGEGGREGGRGGNKGMHAGWEGYRDERLGLHGRSDQGSEGW